MHILEGGKLQISAKLEICGSNEVYIRNQRPRLRRTNLFLVKKTKGGLFCKPAPKFLYFPFLKICVLLNSQKVYVWVRGLS